MHGPTSTGLSLSQADELVITVCTANPHLAAAEAAARQTGQPVALMSIINTFDDCKENLISPVIIIYAADADGDPQIYMGLRHRVAASYHHEADGIDLSQADAHQQQRKDDPHLPPRPAIATSLTRAVMRSLRCMVMQVRKECS